MFYEFDHDYRETDGWTRPVDSASCAARAARQWRPETPAGSQRGILIIN